MKQNNQAGIYIHIPFCVKKCAYCDFLSGSSDIQTQYAYVQALIKEIAARSREYSGIEIATIFFGGGTPSCISEKLIALIMQELRNCYQIAPNAEISIEVNPGTVTREKLEVYYRTGINRTSIGLQSVKEKELQLLGRIHTYKEFLETYELARAVGFSNINIDLISALPGQTKADWMESLEKVVALSPEHISVYSLIIEEGTPFYTKFGMIERTELEIEQQEEVEREMYHQTEQYLEQFGYMHYEISNYALPDKECKHNKSYWTGIPYLGLGLGASSYEQKTDNQYCRSRNLEKLSEYIEFWNDIDTFYDRNWQNEKAHIEMLSRENRMEEFMFLGLRLMKGISIKEFEDRFEVDYNQIYGAVTEKLIQDQLLVHKQTDMENRIYLTEYGIDISNYVMAQFLLN